jgi:hypothetical protein
MCSFLSPSPPSPPFTHLPTMASDLCEMLLNCTPHTISIFAEDGRLIVDIPTSDTVIRLSEEAGVDLAPIMGVPVCRPSSLGAPDGIPSDAQLKGRDGVIVGMLVAPAIAKLLHPLAVYAPDTSVRGAVRKNGQIVGTTRLVLYEA